MIELPFIFVAGLLGSAHCVGMCGGFALTIGSVAPALGENLLRQLIYSSGRVFTYSWLGICAAYGGMRLTQVSGSLPGVLAIVAGVFLIYQGLVVTGVIRRAAVTGKPPCLAGSLFGAWMRGSRRTQVFLAGLATGFLPCGLLYGMLANAASTSNLLSGGVTMAVFGLGTLPVMVLTGFGGSLLGVAQRRRLFYAAGWCVVITGVITLVRGIYGLQSGLSGHTPDCPLCL
jgi:sulfite exporter TauE/SafE